mgnify:CR=1 FL=1
MDRRLGCEIKYGNERPLEEANTFGGCDGRVDNIAVALDVNEEKSIKGMQNQEIHSTEEASEVSGYPYDRLLFNQTVILQFQAGEANLNNGAENVNEKRILEDASTVDSGDSTNAVVNGAESTEGTLILCALNTEKVGVVLKIYIFDNNEIS